MKVTRSTRRAGLVVGVAAGLLAVTASAVALCQRHQRQRLLAVMARFDTAITALEREHRPPLPVREADNAAPALLAAARGISQACRRAYPHDIHELLGRPVGDWTQAERAAIPSASCAASLAALRTAAARPQVAFSPALTKGIGNPRGRSPLISLLSAARLLALDATPARCVDAFAGIMFPNLRDSYEQFRAGDAARQLAIVALTFYGERPPADTGRLLDEVSLASVPNRYTGEPVEAETVGADTSILRYSQAENRMRAMEKAQPGLNRRPPFEYRLTHPVS